MYIQMRYEWDAAKDLSNQRKHGVSFELATLKDHHGEEIIRIISARAAEKNDIRRYQEQEVE
jgi:uncharacterized DUF497 family protein